MLKGLIGKKIGMTQIFDETGAGFTGNSDRSWALLCYAGTPSGEGRLRSGSTWICRGGSQAPDLRSNWVTSRANELPPLRFLREFRLKKSEIQGR